MEPHHTQNIRLHRPPLRPPGEALTFHVSSEGPPMYDASLVRLSHGFTGSAGPGFVENEVPSRLRRKLRRRHHICQPGSFVEIDDPDSVLADPPAWRSACASIATLPLNERNDSIGAYHVDAELDRPDESASNHLQAPGTKTPRQARRCTGKRSPHCGVG